MFIVGFRGRYRPSVVPISGRVKRLKSHFRDDAQLANIARDVRFHLGELHVEGYCRVVIDRLRGCASWLKSCWLWRSCF